MPDAAIALPIALDRAAERIAAAAPRRKAAHRAPGAAISHLDRPVVRPASGSAGGPVHYLPATNALLRRQAGDASLECSGDEAPQAAPLAGAPRPSVTAEPKRVTCIDCLMSMASDNIVRYRQQHPRDAEQALLGLPGYHAAWARAS